MSRCEATTRAGMQCSIDVETEPYEGKYLCHVHHPWGTYQLQKLEKRIQQRKREKNDRSRR